MELSWNDITEEDLKLLYYDDKLSDKEIADKFEVTIGKVKYKRRKFGITVKNMVYEEFVSKNSDLFKQLNSNSKERLLKKENIDSISKAITHFIFRNGPVEDMHANNQLSQADMKVLNKYIVNRIAGLLTTIADNNWMQLELLLFYYRLFGADWDKAEPDMEEINAVIENATKYGSL